MPVLRGAVPQDAPAIAAVHVASRRVAYAGLLPEAEVGGDDEPARAGRWRGYLEAGGGAAVALVGDRIVGFVSWSHQRNDALARRGYSGEVGALYVSPGSQRQGLGRRLLAWALDALRAEGHAAASLEAFAGNARARAFYEAMGGMLLAEWDEERGGRSLGVVAYGWPAPSLGDRERGP